MLATQSIDEEDNLQNEYIGLFSESKTFIIKAN